MVNKTKIKKSIVEYYKKYEKIPYIKRLQEETGLSYYQIKDFLKQLVEEGFLYKEEGRYYLKNPPKENVIFKQARKIDISLWIIKIVFFCISVGTICMSVYYTQSWFSNILNEVWSWIISCVFILFLVFSSLASKIFSENKNLSWYILCKIVFVVTLSFSMFTTISVMYEERKIKEVSNNEEYDEVAIQKDNVAVLDEEIYGLKNDLENIKKDKRLHYDRLNNLYDTEEKRKKDLSGFYRSYNENTKLEEEILKIEKDLKEKREKRTELVNSNSKILKEEDRIKSEKRNFNEWLSEKVFSFLDNDMLDFWISVFPAVFIDIMSSMGMTIAFFLKRQHKKFWLLKKGGKRK